MWGGEGRRLVLQHSLNGWRLRGATLLRWGKDAFSFCASERAGDGEIGVAHKATRDHAGV